ncbi:hypothetical protein, partial [Faecalibaculum rodentium]|uniref:hypothetical protein n=1 Tax=Faecalibaculum rodentium TaxID=1702221 RepID=UPI0023EF76C7
FMTLVIDPKVALLKGVDPIQFCVFFNISFPSDCITLAAWWCGVASGYSVRKLSPKLFVILKNKISEET